MEPAKIELNSDIVASTVLQNKAVITRKGKVCLAQGDNRITLTGLPLNILENSVRVSGQGPEGTKMQGVELRRDFIEEVKDEKLRELEKNVEQLQNEETALRNDIEETTAQLGIMNEMAKTVSSDLGKGYSWKKIEMTDVEKAMKYIHEQMREAHVKLRIKNVELRNLQKKITAAQGEHSRLSSLGEKEVNVISVDIEAAKPGEFDLTVEYAIEGASWYPVYDARVLTEDQKADFTYYGMVRQETGEHWKSTVVTLSTAPDSPSTQLPEISPWYLYAYSPSNDVGASRGMAAPCSAPSPMKEMSKMEAPCGGAGADRFEKKVAAVAQVAKIETRGEAVVYTIEKPADIPSEEETPKKLTIGMFPLNTDIRYLTIPKMIPEVYTKAKVTNTSEFQLLPGDVHLFADSEFIGTTSLGTVAPTEKFEFSLGITKAIKVKRELVKREVASGGMISKDKRIKYAYRIKVENNKKTDVKITVKDQLPYPQHEKIKLDEIKYGEGDEPTKKTDLNILEWTFTLPSGKKKIIDFEFTIVYPADFRIEGEV